MKKHSLSIAALAAAIVMPGVAQAAPTLDQTNPYTGASYYTTFDNIGQSFTAGLTGQLTSIQLSATRTPQSNAGTSIVTIYSGDGLNGTVLGTGSLLASVGTSSYSFDLSSFNVALTAGLSYTFGISSGGSYKLSGDETFGDAYKGGRAYFAGPPLTGSDLAFTTFVNSAGSAASPTPEPATWAMMIAGFGLVGYAMRRRARAAVACA